MKKILLLLFLVIGWQSSGTSHTANCLKIVVTFQVDMRYREVHPDGVFLAMNFYAWEKKPMQQVAAHLWEITLDVPVNYEIMWTYLNGPNGWEPNETLESCGITGNFGGPKRNLITGYTDLTLPVVCFGSCKSCELIATDSEPISSPSFTLFPNPASGSIHLTSSGPLPANARLRITDMQGILIRDCKMDRRDMDLDPLPAGWYLCQILLKEGPYQSLPLLVLKH